MSSPSQLTDLNFVRSVLAASEDCIKVLDLAGNLTFMSEGGMRVMEVSDFNAISGCPWPDFWKEEGNDEARRAVANAAQGLSSRFIGKADTMKGRTKWWDVQVSPIIGDDGKPQAILSVSRDISVLKYSQERANLLTQEMGHRVRNVLTLVQSIVSQTLGSGEPTEIARTKIFERIAAIGKAQDILMQAEWAAASLSDVITSVIAAHADLNRFGISGADVALDAPRALAMALALNELAVNAVKHGALSTAGGSVAIGWTIGAANDLSFTWAETGGPPVAEPQRKGFGSTLLRRAVPAYFDGTAELIYAPTGLTYALTGNTTPGVQ